MCLKFDQWDSERKVNEDFVFDFPNTKENDHLFTSHIDWEDEEKRLTEKENVSPHIVKSVKKK